MATRDENMNKIRNQLAKANENLNTLTDEQLEAIASGSDYTYGEKPKFLAGSVVKGYIPISGFWNSVLWVLVAYDTTEHFTGAVTFYQKVDGRWVYDITTTEGKEYSKVDERFLTEIE